MNVARILYPINVLGPGKRLGIWMVGCDRKCTGCSNPELWKKRTEYEISVSSLLKLIKQISSSYLIDGFTVSGGEPMDQATELSELITGLRGISKDILVYTGYTLDELKKRKDSDTIEILQKIAVLIDGPYIEDLNDNSILRGSSNQSVRILDDHYRNRYETYLETEHNQIQNFATKDGVVSVGIHRKGFTRYI